MFSIRENFSRFITDELGAVTVDYVVLTAAATGLAIAASTELSSGMSYVTRVVSAELGDQGEEVNPLSVSIYDDAFANSSNGWYGAQVSEIFGIGSVLGPISGQNAGAEQVTRRFEFDEEFEKVNVQLDVYALDDLEDDDAGFVYMNGDIVGEITMVDGKTVFNAAEGVEGITVQSVVLENQVELGGAMIDGDESNDSRDSRIALSITVDNPGTSVDFGFGAITSGGPENESYAIDNFKVTGQRPEAEESGGQDGTS